MTIGKHRGTRRRAVGLVCAGLATCLAAAGPDERPGSTPRRVAESYHLYDGQLARLVTLLVSHSPLLQAAQARSRASGERVEQARALSDPQLAYRYFAWTPETRVGPQEHMIELQQALPWGGKRDLQARREASLTRGEEWEAAALERELVARFKRGYFEVAYLQEALRVNAEERELLRRFESIALRRYATGQGIQQSVLKVQTDLSRLEERDSKLREQVRLVTRALCELVARTLSLDPILLDPIDAIPDGAGLVRRSLEAHPRVRALEDRIVADGLWAERRALDRRPDFRLGLGYTLVGDREDPAARVTPPYGNGDDILALSVGVNLPVHRRRIRAGVAEARESQQAQERQLQGVRDELSADIEMALFRLEALHERERLFREVIIPQAEESLASAESAYTTNRLGFLDLLDAERILFQSRLSARRIVADSWIALADLERAAGVPFPDASFVPAPGDSRERP